MKQGEALKLAQEGKTLLLPGWHGYFNWDYSRNQLVFKDGDYQLDGLELLDKIKNRNDWYYIT